MGELSRSGHKGIFESRHRQKRRLTQRSGTLSYKFLLDTPPCFVCGRVAAAKMHSASNYVLDHPLYSLGPGVSIVENNTVTRTQRGFIMYVSLDVRARVQSGLRGFSGTWRTSPGRGISRGDL